MWLGKRENIVVAQSQTVSEAERGNVIAVANLLVSSLGFSAENLSRGEWESGVSPCQDEVLPIFYLRHVGERERESWPLMSRFQGTGKKSRCRRHGKSDRRIQREATGRILRLFLRLTRKIFGQLSFMKNS